MPEPRTAAVADSGVPEHLTLREGLPLEEVEQRIGVAYAAAGLRHRVIAFYLADVDGRGIQQLAGFGSTARWAEARIGMSRREARQLLAAGRALADLPRIDDAFAEARLCWPKVRELVRVATPEHEEKWLELAIGAARRLGQPLGHTLLTGPPGLGKTTIATAAGPGPGGEDAGDLVHGARARLRALPAAAGADRRDARRQGGAMRRGEVAPMAYGDRAPASPPGAAGTDTP